ncbi:MAG: putative sugar O-methyltransferase [Elusimicrobia bacterium]|nr:putative sugar O-methyltransferase [Elusimicrobiota bacterium]
MSHKKLSSQEKQRGINRIFGVIIRRCHLFLKVFFANLRFTSALERVWRARFDRIKRDFLKSDPLFLPSRYWCIISFFYRMVLRGLGFAGFKTTFGRFLAAYEPGNPRLFEALHHLYAAALERRDTWGLLRSIEEPLLGKGDFVVNRGRRLSIDLLQSIDEFYRLQEALNFKKDDPIVFCELGAGYGRLAEIVMTAMPNATYLIFDLPETLLLSQYYLSTLHPERKTAFYPESLEYTRSREKLASCRLVFGLPQQLRELPENYVNVFINVYSFMEMSARQVNGYFSIIEQLQVDALYIKEHKHEINLFDQVVHTDENYPIRPSWRRIYHGTSALFEHVFEAVYRIDKIQ